MLVGSPTSNLSSLPIYYMSTILFSKTFVEKINIIIRRFWWVGVQVDNPTSPIAFHSWEDICQSKENGALGIRDLYSINKSLITHAAWNIVTNKNNLLTSIFKAKYFLNSSFGALPLKDLGLFSSPLFSKSGMVYTKTVCTKFMQETLLSSPLPGILFGESSMAICFFLSLKILCRVLWQIFGSPILTTGI